MQRRRRSLRVRGTAVPFLSTVLLLVSACLVSGAGLAADGAIHAGKSQRLQQSYHWYDGQRQRTVWLNPVLEAQFYPDPTVPAEQVKSLTGGAQVVWDSAFIRITERSEAAAATRSRATAADRSPVFHDGPTSEGSVRALPGGLVVYLPAEWSAAQVGEWLTGKGLTVLRQIPVAPNVLLLDSPPGLATLELANALYESGEVRAAFPDWWRQGVPK